MNPPPPEALPHLRGVGTMFDYSYFAAIDLAKNDFSVHAVDSNCKVILHKSVTRSKRAVVLITKCVFSSRQITP